MAKKKKDEEVVETKPTGEIDSTEVYKDIDSTAPEAYEAKDSFA